MKHIKFLLFMLTLFFCFTFIYNDLNSRLQNITELNTRYRAFSLRVLQEQLNGAVTDRRIESIENFAGITKMIGYIIDQDNADLILYGIVDGDLPKLHLEDFVVALRNVWGLYRHKYGHHNPACSIDPYSHNSKRLERIAQSITPHISRSLLQEIKQFEEACTALQEVNVYGIPFHTRFAKIMVQADYKMKKYVDGSESLPFEDYSCLIDIYIAKMIRDVENNESPPLVMTNWNRFWFYPGPQFLTESDNIVRIDRCPVYLLTNRIYHSGGQLRDSRQVDCLAEKFAEYITLNYNKIKKVLPIYQELENVFRFVALSRAIHLKSAHEKSGIDLSYLLHQFPIPVDSVNKELPGCFSMKSDTIWQSATTGFCYALPSCGGVEIDINIKGSNFISIEHGYVTEFASSAIASRPSQGALSWDINLRISNFLINAIASNSDARSQILFVVSKRKNNKQMVDLISSDKQIEVPRDQITSFINNPKQLSVLDPLFPKRRGKETVNIILVTDGFKGERSKLLLAIRQRYGDQYRPWDDDEMTLGMKNLQNLPTIKGVSDIAVYFDMNRKCLEKAERKLLSEIITFLKNNNIEVIKNLIETPASNIIIITHQKAEKFDKYLNKRYLKNFLSSEALKFNRLKNVFSYYKSQE